MEFFASLEDDRNPKRPRMESDSAKLEEQERISGVVNGNLFLKLLCSITKQDKQQTNLIPASITNANF